MHEKKAPEVRFRGFRGEWERHELGHIGNTYTGLSGKTKNDFGHGSAKYVTYMNVFSNTIANPHGIETIEIDATQNEIKMGDVFFTTSSETPEEVGMSSVWLEDTRNVYLNSFCFGYRTEKIFDYYYLAYMLRSPSVREKIIFLAQGISRYNISKNKAMNISVPIPKMQEQTKIGDLFKNLDNLIAQNQKKYDKLVNMKKACLDKMFPKDGADTPEVRFMGFSGEWEKKELESTVDFLDEQRKPISAETRESGAHPYYGASGIIDYVKDYLFAEELVLLSEDGANIIDRNYRVSFLAKGEYWVNNHAHVLKSRQGYCNGFICEALERLNYERYNTGTAQPKLNQEVCRNIVIIVPTFEEQQQIFVFFQTLDNLITLRKTKLEKLKNIKKACLDKMFI